MLIKIIYKNFLFFFISLILLTIPFFEFINQNFGDYNINDYHSIFFNYIIILISGIIFSSFIYFFFFKKFQSIFFFYVTFIFFFFKWSELNLFLKIIYVPYYPYISIIIILLFSLFFFSSLVSKNNTELKKFCILFLSMYFFFLLSIFFYNKFEFDFNFKNSQINFSKNNNLSYLKKKKITNNSKANIYYVILDGAISLERFEEIYSISSLKLKSKLNLSDFSYMPMNSSYFDTALSIGSIFNLNYVSEDFTNDKKNFYPHILSKRNFKNNKPNLVRILEENNYEFKWYSNMNMDCKFINDEICFGSNNKNFNKYLNTYFIINFYSSTPLIAIISKFNSSLINKQYFEKNDALKTFLSNKPRLDKNKSYFFFIHSMMPHDPYFYDENCNYINNQIINNQNTITLGYKMNYLCGLKRVKEFQDYIISKDKNAIVIIQGDHGYFFKNKEVLILRQDSFNKYINSLYENDQKELLKNYSTLNLIKHGICQIPKKTHLDNVNSIIFAVNCAIGLDIKYKNKKTFFSYEKEIKLGK